MNRKILATFLIISITVMLSPAIKSVSSSGIPNPETITYTTAIGPDFAGGSDPAWAYDTASSAMIQQVYEPLFMYANTSINSFVPMLADWWNGYTGDGHTAGDLAVPLNPSIPSNLTYLNSLGIYPPAWAKQTWLFHIRSSVQWQNAVYGNLAPRDFVYSVQRGLLMDAISGVQDWMFYGPLLGVAGSYQWCNSSGVIPPANYNGIFTAGGTTGMGEAIRDCVQGNDANGYVALNLVSPYMPLMQILTQSWATVTCEKWVIQNGGINTTIALSNNPNNYTEFINHYQPAVSPLMDSSVVNSAYPMMGTGPYILKVFNTDPYTGFQYFKRFDNYWQGWPAPGSQGFANYAHIKIVQDWTSRKAQFLSNDSALQCDLTDVLRANYAELHVSGKDSPTLEGISLTKVPVEIADFFHFCYNVSSASPYMPRLGGVDTPTLFSDRDLREAFMYCFNDSQYIQQYFLGEVIQPTTFMCNGTAYYNGSIPVRQYNLDQAVEHFKLAWGGRVWSQGITVRLVSNIGGAGPSIAQNIYTMIANAVAYINATYGTKLNVIVEALPWIFYFPALHNRQLTCFTIGWLADYPDPDDWAVPFISSHGDYSGKLQQIMYGINTTSLNAAWSSMTPHSTWGPIPFTDPLGDLVTSLNNSYVDRLIQVAPTQTDDMRSKIYNELMDIYYAEAASFPLYQSVARHYERNWTQGWIGRYSNNPVAPGPYFYQMWKSTPDHDVAVTTVTSSRPAVGKGFNQTINVTVANLGVTTETFTVTVYANAASIASQNVTLLSGRSTTITFTWNTSSIGQGNYTISAYATPASGETNWANNSCTGGSVQITTVGDLGTRVGGTDALGVFDGRVTSTDLSLFLQCYKGTAPSAYMYLGDLGSRIGTTNKFFVCDGSVTSTDLQLFLQCYKGLGP
jgi:peptide/nickel transport system substrate-binding protein